MMSQNQTKVNKDKIFLRYHALTLISLNGINKLFSIFESNPKSLEANLKFLLVAASAFIVRTNSNTKQNFQSFRNRCGK
jgi:hypothetical protein